MIISDKQELRRCVKQLVRRADVCEADLSFDLINGELGVDAMLDLWARPAPTPGQAMKRACAEQTPFHPDASAMFAALDAMDLPVKDLDRAKEQQDAYDRSGYLREILDTMRAKGVFVRVSAHNPVVQFEDERCLALLAVDASMYVPGRYGVDYASAAAKIAESARICGARNLLLEQFDHLALCYCLLPVCQDHGLVLHLHVRTQEELKTFLDLLDNFEGVRALVSAEKEIEMALIDAAAIRTRITVCLSDIAHFRYALAHLGTRFVAYSAQATQPEQMLGRWSIAKEAIWQELVEAYLPLARAGYALESSAIERDVRRLLSGNLLALCGLENNLSYNNTID